MYYYSFLVIIVFAMDVIIVIIILTSPFVTAPGLGSDSLVLSFELLKTTLN